MADLARVFDESELGRIPGGRASFEIAVLSSWAGRTCEVDVPRRLACAPCEGGGCDACERRGAYRLEDGDAERRVGVKLPSVLAARTRIRIGQPFGVDSVVGVLLLDVVIGDEPSASCVVVPEPEQPIVRAPEGAAASRLNPSLVAFAALVLILVILLVLRAVT